MQVKSLSLESSTKHVALRHGLLIYFKGYQLRYYIVLLSSRCSLGRNPPEVRIPIC